MFYFFAIMFYSRSDLRRFPADFLLSSSLVVVADAFERVYSSFFFHRRSTNSSLEPCSQHNRFGPWTYVKDPMELFSSSCRQPTVLVRRVRVCVQNLWRMSTYFVAIDDQAVGMMSMLLDMSAGAGDRDERYIRDS